MGDVGVVLSLILSGVAAVAAIAAAAIAHKGNQLTRSAIERDHEDHVVRWDQDFPEPGVYRITNVGLHTANSVRFDVNIGDRTVSRDIEVMDPGDSADFDAQPELAAERREFDTSRRSGSLIAYIPSGWVSYNVAWLSSAGKRHTAKSRGFSTDYGLR